MLTKEDLEAIRARCDAATQGPWKQHVLDATCVVNENDDVIAALQSERDYSEQVAADASFIAHARQDIPALLDALEAANSRLRVLEGEGWIEWNGGECPLDPETLHEVRLRGDEGVYPGRHPNLWDWKHRGVPGDIIAYRVLP